MRDAFVKEDIDLRAELKTLMKHNMYEVLVQRCSKKVRCKCFNNVHNEPTSKCPICLGTGWVFKFEKVKAFNQDIRASIGNAIITTDIARLYNENKTFFFEHTTKLNLGDYIWEVTWKNDKPISLVSLYKIQAIDCKRGLDGHIEFKSVMAKKESIDVDFKNMYIGKAWRELENG